MRHFPALTLVLTSLLALSPAVRAAKPAPAPAPAAAPAAPAAPALSADDAAAAQFHVVAGEMAAGRQQPQLAAREFLAALSSIDDAELAKRATGLAVEAQDQELAMQAAQRWQQIEPSAMDAREIIAQVSLLRGDTTETLAQTKAIVDGHGGGVDDAFRVVAGILSRGGPQSADNALDVIQQLAAQYPKSAGAQHAVALVAMHYRRMEIADGASQRALQLAPKSKDEKLLRIGVLVRLGRISEADTAVDQLTKKDPAGAELRLAYAKLLLESNQREPARSQLRKIVADKPDNIDAKFALAVMAISDRDFDTAKTLLTPMLNGERAQDAALQLGRMAEINNDPDAALAYYAQVSSGAQGFEAAIRQSAVLARVGRIDEARAMLHRLRDRYPQLATRFTLAEGELLVNSNHDADALQVFNEGLADDPDNADLLYGRSLINERLNHIDAAEKDLRTVIADDPDNVRSLNALGYMLAVHTKRLDEAQALVGRALQLNPDDAAIIDSMGWIEFKRGNTAAARDLLTRAFSDFPDPEVAAHLGEVLWALGEKDQARTIWNDALRTSPDHPVLKETVQRLNR